MQDPGLGALLLMLWERAGSARPAAGTGWGGSTESNVKKNLHHCLFSERGKKKIDLMVIEHLPPDLGEGGESERAFFQALLVAAPGRASPAPCCLVRGPGPGTGTMWTGEGEGDSD